MRNRMYDPALGQFLSRDPLAARTGRAYTYGHGDPVNFVDPYGLIRIPGTNITIGEGCDVGYADSGGCVGGSIGADDVQKATEFVSDAAATGAMLAGGTTLLCPVCAPVTGPVAGGLATLSGVSGGISAALQCGVSGVRSRDCATGVAVQLVPAVGGSVLKTAIGPVDVAARRLVLSSAELKGLTITIEQAFALGLGALERRQSAQYQSTVPAK
jgi:hypothetical protein